MIARLRIAVLTLALVGALLGTLTAASSVAAQDALRAPLPTPVKVKLGMLNVPALSPLWLLPEYAAKYNIQMEPVMFQRFADARTALASGDLDITAFGPQDISLGLGQGIKSMVGVAGVGSGNDCLVVRKGDDIKDWKSLEGKTIGVGAGSISWLKFAASVQENGLDYGKLKIINIMGGGTNYLKALQGKEIDLAVVWHPFCAQGIVDGYAQYPSIDHNRSKTVGGLISVLAVNRGFMEKNRDAVQRLATLLLLSPFAPSAWPQTAGPSSEQLTLDAAVASATRNNREVKNAVLEVDKSENRIAATRTERYPHFKVGVEQSYLLAPLDLTFERGVFGTFPGTGPIPDKETTLRTPTGWTTAISAGVVQPVAALYRIGLGIERLEVGREIARELLRGQRLAVVNDVKRSYYGALQTEASLEAVEESIGFYRELLRVVEENVRQQAALPGDALDVRVRLTRAEYTALTLRNSLASRKEELNQLIGRDVNTEFRLVPVADVSPLETDLAAARARALRRRPEITGGQLRSKEAEYAVRMKTAEYIPDFNLVLKYFSPITSDVLPKNIAYAGFEFSWDVFDWGRKKLEMAELKKTVEQATNRLADIEPQIVREVNGSQRKLQEARTLLDVSRLALEAEREKLRVALNRYAQQLVLLKDTLQSQSAVADANQQYQQALLSFWMARADFERAVGEE